jgi:hypothetical protein
MPKKFIKMKTKLTITLVFFISFSIYSQVGIGTDTPNSSAILEISSLNKGLLIPRMTEAQRKAISNPPVGLLVYQTNGQAFYYKDHFWWKILASNDNKSFMVGSIKGGIPNYGSQNLSFGFGNFAYATKGDNNTAIGFMAISGSDGSGNTAVGSNAMRQGRTIADGSYNTAVGVRALSNGDDGDYNTAIGASSIEKVEGDNNSGLGNRTLFNTTTGDANTAVGSNAGDTNTTGSNNTLIGSNSDVGSNNLTNATAIGYNAIVDASNKIRLGDSNITLVETSGTVSATAFIGDGSQLTNLPRAGIVAPKSGANVTLSDSDHGKIFFTQSSNQPSFPDPDTLSEGFTCTIVNYSNYEGSLTAATATFVGVRSHNKYRTEDHTGSLVSSNTLGIGGWSFPVSKIGFMSGGTLQIRVIKINGSNYYFVSGDFYYPNS